MPKALAAVCFLGVARSVAMRRRPGIARAVMQVPSFLFRMNPQMAWTIIIWIKSAGCLRNAY